MEPIIPQQQNLTTPELLPPHKHFLNKKFIVTFVILLLVGAGACAGIWYWQKNMMTIGPGLPPPCFSVQAQYGFLITLPDSWKGCTILNSQWTGDKASDVIDHGPIITLRHPLWTTANPREDMPIMIFTTMQWAEVQSESMYLGAAPIPPSVLGQNSKYVLALPARYNFDYRTGWEEVDQLVHTLKAFEPTK